MMSHKFITLSQAETLYDDLRQRLTIATDSQVTAIITNYGLSEEEEEIIEKNPNSLFIETEPVTGNGEVIGRVTDTTISDIVSAYNNGINTILHTCTSDGTEVYLTLVGISATESKNGTEYFLVFGSYDVTQSLFPTQQVDLDGYVVLLYEEGR